MRRVKRISEIVQHKIVQQKIVQHKVFARSSEESLQSCSSNSPGLLTSRCKNKADEI